MSWRQLHGYTKRTVRTVITLSGGIEHCCYYYLLNITKVFAFFLKHGFNHIGTLNDLEMQRYLLNIAYIGTRYK